MKKPEAGRRPAPSRQPAARKPARPRGPATEEPQANAARQALAENSPEEGEIRPVGGFNAVLAALKSRPRACRRLWVAEGRRSGPQLDEIFGLAKSHGLSVKIRPRRDLDRQYGRPEHQGVLAFFDPIEYTEFEDLLAALPPEGPAVLLALDKVEDPRNLGAMMRGAAFFGAAGVLIPRERAASLTSAALSAAAGGAEEVPLARLVNLARALAELKNHGFWLVGAEGGGREGLSGFKFPERCVLVLGSEGRGLSPLIAGTCDFLVSIPRLSSSVTSLNVSVAGGIFLFEYLRQRKISA